MRGFINNVATILGLILASFGIYGIACALSSPFSLLGGIFYLVVGLCVSLSSSVAMRYNLMEMMPRELSLSLQEK